MKKAKKYTFYKCPHGKVQSTKIKMPYSVQGEYCKNNCDLYGNGCKLFAYYY